MNYINKDAHFAIPVVPGTIFKFILIWIYHVLF